MESIGDIFSRNFTTISIPKVKNRGNFTMVPNSFIISKELSIYEKMTWIVIKKYLMIHRTCWPSISTIAKNVPCSESSVKKAIKGLELKSYISKERKLNRRSNVYKVMNGSP